MWWMVMALAADPCADGDIRVVNVGSPLYGVYALIGERTVLVDSWSPGHERRILYNLQRAGVDPVTLSAIVLTHAHADHVGSARALAEQTGATVIIGAGDEQLLIRGRNPPLHPTGPAGRAFLPFAGHRFPGLPADEVVATPVDLSAWGVPGEIRRVGGHTEGSLVVVLPDGRAVIGDLVRSRLPGPKDVPALHFFHDDLQRAHAALGELVAEGAQCFYIGHGGPLSAKAVEAFLPEQAGR